MPEKLYPLKLYFRHAPNAVALIGSLLLNAITWAYLLWNIRPQEDLIFLHYTILFGVDFFGPWWKIIYLPLGGLAIILVNTVLGWVLFARDAFANYVLLAVCLLSQCLLLVAGVLLVLLNV